MKKIFILTALILSAACSRPITKESAIEKLSSLPEYQAMFFAPMHIGRHILTGENHTNPQAYIDRTFGTLLKAELIKIDIHETNAWRTVIDIQLTDKGTKMTDPRRSDNEHAFVAVCHIHPVAVDTIIPLGKDSITCKYVIEQQEVTPFGEFLNFEQGKQIKTVINLLK